MRVTNVWGTLNCLNEPFNKFRQGDSLIRGSLTLIFMLEVLFIIGLVFQPQNSFWDLIFFAILRILWDLSFLTEG